MTRCWGARSEPPIGVPPVRVAVDAANAALAAAAIPDGALRAVGVACPATSIRGRASSGWPSTSTPVTCPSGESLARALGVPCFVDHDARAAAAWLAARPGATGDLAYLSIGTGIAAGVVLDGQTLMGDNGLAGEIGHCVADPDGPVCPCGLRGCLEVMASGPAVARAANEALDAGEASVLRDRSTDVPLTAADVYAAADQGDPLALRVTDVAAGAIARAVRSLVLSYGVATVVVGGGPSRAGVSFTRPLMDHLADERSASALMRRAFLGTVEVLPPDAQPTAWGAVTVARIGLQQTHTMDSERRDATLDET